MNLESVNQVETEGTERLENDEADTSRVLVTSFRRIIVKRKEAFNRREKIDSSRPDGFIWPHMDDWKALRALIRTDGPHVLLPFVAMEGCTGKAWQTNCHARDCRNKATRRCICSVKVPRCEPCFIWHMLSVEGRQPWLVLHESDEE